MRDVTMPSLGADMEQGKILQWYVEPGTAVAKRDVVALVETEKAAIEIEVFADGVVEQLLVGEGETVPVGTPIAWIRDEAASPAEQAAAPERAAAGPPGEPEAAPSDHELPPPDGEATPPPREAAPAPREAGEPAEVESAESARVTASPLVRRLARARGIDLTRVEPSGPGGRVRRRDIEIANGGPPPAPSSSRRASPRARRLAATHGVDLATIDATGPHGSVTGDDVRQALDRAAAGRAWGAPAAATETSGPPEVSVEPGETPRPTTDGEPAGAGGAAAATTAQRQEAVRRATGRLMARSKRDIPHYYLGQHVDVEPALSWLEDQNDQRPVRERLLPAVLLLKATALAAREVPDLNGFWIDDALQPSEAVHLGVAIALRGGGLAAPAILDAHAKSLDELMVALSDLITRTRAGRLRGSEMSSPTLTVTSLGDQGVETVYGVIYPPQVALVGFGCIVARPWAVDGLLGVRRVVSATLSADHRASDGARGARLLSAIDRYLQRPEDL